MAKLPAVTTGAAKGLAFYEAAAQIIPVLLLVLAIQTRSFDTSRPVSMWFKGRNEPVGIGLGSLDALVLMALYGVVVAAEIVALATLHSGDVELWRRDFVGLVVLGLFVFIGFVASGLIPQGSDDRL